MKPNKIIKEKFPFLGELVSIYKPDNVKVARANKGLLDRVGYSYSHYWPTGYSAKSEYYFVFDGKGIYPVPHEGSYVNEGVCHDAWEGMSIRTFCSENKVNPKIIVQLSLEGNNTKMIIYQLSSAVKSKKRNGSKR